MNFLGLAAVLSAVGMYALARYVRHAKTLEAVSSVASLAGSAAEYYNASGCDAAVRRFAARGPRHAPLPAELARVGPGGRPTVRGKRYQSNLADWSASPWRELRFSIVQPQCYRYSFEAEGAGRRRRRRHRRGRSRRRRRAFDVLARRRPPTKRLAAQVAKTMTRRTRRSSRASLHPRRARDWRSAPRLAAGGGRAGVRRAISMRRGSSSRRKAWRVSALPRVAYAETNRKFPDSAPLTPSVPPRGKKEADPPGTWDNATWTSARLPSLRPRAFRMPMRSRSRARRAAPRSSRRRAGTSTATASEHVRDRAAGRATGEKPRVDARDVRRGGARMKQRSGRRPWRRPRSCSLRAGHRGRAAAASRRTSKARASATTCSCCRRRAAPRDDARL